MAVLRIGSATRRESGLGFMNCVSSRIVVPPWPIFKEATVGFRDPPLEDKYTLNEAATQTELVSFPTQQKHLKH